MVKRAAEAVEAEPQSLKKGDRPLKREDYDEAGDFEDEFEDEYDSEDGIFEAGVDGRPDAERETEESRGMWFAPVALCDFHQIEGYLHLLTQPRWDGCRSANFHTRQKQT